jgi:hypothetical protein
VKPSGQREVPVKKRPSLPFRARTLACLLSCALVALPGVARAQDGGVPEDAPRIVKLESGHYDVNGPAFKALDDEMVRLQGVERQHKSESWVKVVLIAGAVGLAAGLAAGVIVGVSIPRK